MPKWTFSFYALIVLAFLLGGLSISCGPAASPQTIEQTTPQENNPPTNVFIEGPAEIKPGTEVELACAARDKDSDILTFTWIADNSTITGDGRIVKWVVPNTVGEYSVNVSVSDGKGGVATGTRSFKITETPYAVEVEDKTIYLKMGLPASAPVRQSSRVRSYTTTDIKCIVEGKDSSELSFKWSANAGKLMGTAIDEGKADSVGWIAPGQAEKYQVTVTVTDKSGNTARGEVDFDVFCCKE